MHPVQWDVNQLVYDHFNSIQRYFVSPWLFGENKQTFELLRSNKITRPLITNLIPVSVDNKWYNYIDTVYFNVNTKLAILVVDQADQPGTVTPNLITGPLQYVHERNLAIHCNNTNTPLEEYYISNNIPIDYNSIDYNVIINNNNNDDFITSSYNFNNNNSNSNDNLDICWIPIVIWEDRTGRDELIEFVNYIINTKYPPMAIIDVKGLNVDEWSTPQVYKNTSTWVLSYEMDTTNYYQQTISILNGKIINIQLIHDNMEEISDDIRSDPIYNDDIQFINTLAKQAAANDPIVGQSTFMPFIRLDGSDIEWRICMGGECPGGNLFTDALRWYTKSHVAFLSSGGIRGPGWDAGNVHVSNIWSMLPFSNTQCTGIMSGLSIFRLLDYSTYAATFLSTYTPRGDRLLQVSGLRYTYNTQLPANETTSRIVNIELWDDDKQTYVPLERLGLYKFATDSWLCSGFDPYPSLLNQELVVEGEERGVIGNTLHQQIVAEYLTFLSQNNTPPIIYNATVQGRLVNDTSITTPLDWYQTPDDCTSGTLWTQSLLTCVQCPATSGVRFTEELHEFNGESGSEETYEARAELINGENFPISVKLKSTPSWIMFKSSTTLISQYRLDPGQVQSWDYSATAKNLETGTAASSISFAVTLESNEFPGCVGDDTKFDVFMRVAPEPELSKPGSIRAIGLSFMGLAVCTSIFFGVWVMTHWEKRIVKAMQPQFLISICFGVLGIALSIIPLSIQDDITSQTGRNMACMATPWLVSMGFMVAILSLYAKLWRINQVFQGQQFRRVTVTSTRVSAFCASLLAINIVLLTIWTALDPLKWEIRHVADETWNQYGTCVTNQITGRVMFALTLAFNVVALCIACHQAYRARNISDEYSESKHLGIALFGWVEIVLVGFPVLFLIERDNSNARYFLQVILITCICMSMLLIIFIPIMVHFHAHKRRVSQEGIPAGGRGRRTIVTGISLPNNSMVANFHASMNGSYTFPSEELRIVESRASNNFGNATSLSNSSGTADSQQERLRSTTSLSTSSTISRSEMRSSLDYTGKVGQLDVVEEGLESVGNNSI